MGRYLSQTSKQKPIINKMPTYRQLQHSAILISIISILYCSAEGAVSIAFGEESSSRSLIFFGIQSGIEVASACIVLWRFRRYTRTGDEENTGADGAQGGKVGTGPREEVISPADLRYVFLVPYSFCLHVFSEEPIYIYSFSLTFLPSTTPSFLFISSIFTRAPIPSEYNGARVFFYLLLEMIFNLRFLTNNNLISHKFSLFAV